MDYNFLLKLISRVVILVTAIPVHESAHGLVSLWLGDPTAKRAGRISLNPLRHFDMLGTLCLLAVGIGWAKPVPIDPRYYKNPRAGMALSALAGPVSNLLMAYVAMCLYKIVAYTAPAASGFWSYAALVLYYMVIIDVYLAIFNLMPFPPFDGSRIYTAFLPERIYFGIMKYERYIFIAVFALLMLTSVFDAPLTAATNAVLTFLDKVTGLIDLVAGSHLAQSAL
ncbi:MAG: site-2 protease family protein [Oscillospiraceae bacterium]|nr:site-2 protease family protein [Oscillospiraceae bacterium]